MKFGLSEATIDKIHSVLKKKPEIAEVIIYGSRAKGDYREGSDIDIVLKGEGISHDVQSKLRHELDDLNTPYMFDISVYDSIDSKSLLEHINQVGQFFLKRISSNSFFKSWLKHFSLRPGKK